MKLIRFELRKLIYSKKFLYLLAFIIIGIVGLFVRNVLFQEKVIKEEKEQINSYQRQSYWLEDSYEQQLIRKPNDEEAKERLQLMQHISEALRHKAELIGSPSDWREFLEWDNTFMTYVLAYLDREGEFGINKRDITHKQAINNRLLEDNISPEHRYSISMPLFLKQMVDLFINLGGLIILLVLVGDILVYEFENESIKLLYTQPLKRTGIFVSKFVTVCIVYFIIIGLLFGLASMLSYTFGEKGTFQYPILIEKHQQLDFITVFEYIFQAMVTTTVTLFLMVSLSLLYSILFKQTLFMLFSVVLTLFGGFALFSIIPWSFMSWVNPFQYLLGEERIIKQIFQSWYDGIPIIIALTILLVIITWRRIKTSYI
ncbi:MAG TPA: ABC transporter permease subunit [Cerasibacillus sp.]|uniref:ABC transporter permease subunit n=1 Tax=Cerasibacillus sp. TaxID=2498711 RepID=UPI002F41265B